MYIRNSVLRQQGVRPSVVLGLRGRVRRAEATASTLRNGLETVRSVTAAVNTPNGTTRKIARLLDEALA